LLGITDETIALDVDMTAAYLLERNDIERERYARRLQRELNREHAYLTGLAVNGLEIPKLPDEDEEEWQQKAFEDDGCSRGGCVYCVIVDGEFRGCSASDEIRRAASVAAGSGGALR
jgi:hypothetical protein